MSATLQERAIAIEAGVVSLSQGTESYSIGRVPIDDIEAVSMARRRRSSPTRSKKLAAAEGLSITERADESDGYTSEEQACSSSLEVGDDSDGIMSAGEAYDKASRRDRMVRVRNTFITIEDEETGKVQTKKRAQSWHVSTLDLMDDARIHEADHFFESKPALCESSTGETVDDVVAPVAPLSEHFVKDDSAKQVPCPAYQARRPTALDRGISPECHSALSTPGTCSTSASSEHVKQLSCDSGASLTSSLVRTYSLERNSACNTPRSSSMSETMESAASIGTGRTDVTKAVPQNFEAVVGRAYMLGEPSNLVVPLVGIPCGPMVQPVFAMPSIPSADVPGVLMDTAHQAMMPTSTMVNWLPSIGSAGHYRKLCKPCAFGRDKCRNGANCEFCHICKPVEKSKRGRCILKRRKQAEELHNDLLDFQSDMQRA
jgi:hypothetical protein